MPLITLGFGGGCHWCTEAVFQAFRSVETVEQGFIRSAPPDDTWSEAARVTFDPAVLPLEVLIEAHLLTHSATSDHTMRGKYRSAVYVSDPADTPAVQAALDAQRPAFDPPLVTRVLPLIAFKPSDARFQNYYATDADRPFCRTYIAPKLAKLRERFGRET
ncbi:peptide methionine sulfoxide reductase [Brevundimonas sp. Leaf363]|uniref:peptide-methionine (S)-S-oxide reductase n=1 Tax=Brevundimonas sp. Leaf363 TaxID=1736353 RepID=UPI0006F5417A|nr:peptide-methionine (S)-S-oxide reductase [Brevundimonas sp. Leaf363]KQS55744.1 peptide methionine sulfoxide reductase [Brevundimonas sp. Leaf363]